MTLLETWLGLAGPWKKVFPQRRSATRAIRQGLGALTCLGRRTLTRIIWTNGREQRSWAAEYFLHSRVKWQPQELFTPIRERALDLCSGKLLGVAVDDTRLHKTGRCIKQAFHQRDPLSPAFHTNLILGLRFLQASLLVLLHRRDAVSCRALPIRFEESSPIKRPPRKACKKEWKKYRLAAKQHNLSTHFVDMVRGLRQDFDEAGGNDKILVVTADGSFCNRTVFTASRDRTEIIARTRKDAVLCRLAPQNSRRFYDANKFTPESVRQDDTVSWKTTKVFYGEKKAQGAVQERRDRILARRCPEDTPAPHSGGPNSLPQAQERQALLPAACLPAHYRQGTFRESSPSDLP